MRILHLTSFLQGGAGRAIASLAIGQRGDGHDVIVITSRTGAPGYGNYPVHLDAVADAGVSIEEVDSLFTRDREAHEKVITHVERRYGGIASFDVVHAHAAVPSAIALRLRQRAALRVPIVQTMHGWGIAKTTEQRQADIAALKAIDAIAVPAQVSSDLLQSFGVAAGSIEVIPYGVAPRVTAGSGDAPLLADIAEWRRSGGSAVCCAGTIGERKNQRVIVDALRMLGDPGVRAVFVGEGDTDGLRQHAERAGVVDQVRITGYRDDARDVVATCDVIVLPSLSEGQPLTILEAFCDRVPVVASTIPELRELVKAGDTGWLAEPTDAADIARAIRMALAQDRGERAAMIERAFADWRTKFSLDVMCSRYSAWYRRVIGDSRVANHQSAIADRGSRTD